jgi:hypothetical protein
MCRPNYQSASDTSSHISSLLIRIEVCEIQREREKSVYRRSLKCYMIINRLNFVEIIFTMENKMAVTEIICLLM